MLRSWIDLFFSQKAVVLYNVYALCGLSDLKAAISIWSTNNTLETLSEGPDQEHDLVQAVRTE